MKGIQNTSTNNFSTIIGNNRKFVVLKFQRDYSWGNEQWDDLWQDIETMIADKEDHYMGYLVLQTNNDKDFQIIDGYNITINPNARIGRNCNIHKGVVIGQTNRGSRKGAPTIGDQVWIGINAAIVGNITIGDDVLIAPNSYVNIDIPSYSVVFGNPCIIKHRDWATEDYVNYPVD